MKMRILSMLLAFAMLFGMMPAVAFAEDTEPVEATETVETTEPEQSAELVTCSAFYVNPLYADMIDAQVLESAYYQNQVFNSGIEVAAEDTCYTTPAEAAAVLREAMENRNTTVVIPYEIPASYLEYEDGMLDLGMEIFDIAFAHTGVPTQGDYLKWHYQMWGVKANGYWNHEMTAVIADLTFTLSYHTDTAQEAAVTSRVDSLLAELNPTGTDYQKIKTVYDWMCDNIEYDYDNLNVPTYYLKYSAYAALINGTSVCQGYANLLYRLALEMGIDCRVITGYSANGSGEPEAHAWNIVKLGDYYYNLDATWDSSYAQVGLAYPYFLRSEASFENHYRNSDYTTSAFHAKYPMGEEDYDPSQDVVEDENVIASGTCDEFLTWTLNEEGTLTISGEGLMEDFYSNEVPWYEWLEEIKKVVIKDGVISIGALAFRNCVNLASVEIADSVTDIGAHVFSQCKKLTDVELPNSVTSLGIGAFEYSGIVNISLSDSLEVIDQGTFNACVGLESIVIPDGVISLEKGVFWDCANLKSIKLPNTLETIGAEVFYNCTSLTELAIPDSVTCIWSWAFDNAGLTSITIPANVTEMWEAAFANCSNLTGIWVDPKNPKYSSDASGALLDKEQKTLLQVPGGLSGTYEIPNTVTTIDGYAVKACEKLTEVKIPDSVTTIESGAFSGCTGLKNVSIPDSITNIGEWTFYGCSDLTVVVLPDTVNEIAESAFDDCDRIWHVLFAGTEDQWNALTIAKNNTALKKATRHYNAKGDEVIAVDKTTCTETIFCECTICGAVLSEEIPGGGHNMGSWTTTKEATCTEDGSKSRTCSSCGYSETEVITASGHNHAPNVTDPTCTEKGYTTYTCACGDTYVSDEVSALNHNMGDWVITDATCTADGSKTRACARCDHTETEVIPATGHSHIPNVTAPTCITGGYTTYTCACGDTYVADEVPALNHNMGDWVITDATCTADGSKTRACTRCDFAETEVITAPGHTHVPVVTAPTCTEKGYTTYTCACGDTYVADEVPALDHDHAYSLTAEPTEKGAGSLTGICTRCGDEVLVALPKLNKDDYTYEVELEPTEETEGTARYVWKNTDYGTYTFCVTLNKLGAANLGDVSGDGVINVLDLMYLANYFAKGETINKENADVNKDGSLDVRDLMFLANVFAGKETLK